MGCRKLMGDGTDSSAADDPWTSAVPWRWQPRVIHPDLLNPDQSMAELLKRREGNGHNMVEVAGVELAVEMASITLGVIELKNTWIWWPHPLGAPKAAAIYCFLRPVEDDNWRGWEELWKLNVAPRVRLFYWKLLRGRLPTKGMLHALRFDGDDKCNLCELFTENIEHLFYVCRYSKEIWTILGQVQPELEEMEAWLDWSASLRLRGGVGRVTTASERDIAAMCWGIWKQQNRVVFAKVTQEKVEWRRPRRGRVKVNVDGAFRLGACQAGAGAIIRDDKGKVVMVRWEPTPTVSPLHAEAWAMQMGLSLLSGDQFVEVESDSEQLVKILREEGPCPWQVQCIVREYKTTLAKLAECTISHVRKSGNRAADWAARRGLGATQIGTIREGDLCHQNCTPWFRWIVVHLGTVKNS
ncbi:uncharacterized protein [Typha latifolia]|uniref:uncharacterized protein n=1 Tax=Typha latifolia TaxID=4733 RepID=UPI003C2C628D